MPHACISHGYNNAASYDYHQPNHLSSTYANNFHAHSTIELRNGGFYSTYNSGLNTESIEHSSDDDDKKKQSTNVADYFIERKPIYHNGNTNEFYSTNHSTVSTAEQTKSMETICHTKKHKEDTVSSKFFPSALLSTFCG